MVFWAALLVLFVSVVAGTAFAIVRGIQLWRDVKRVGGSFGRELETISRMTAQIEIQMSRAEAATRRLQEATGRLAASRAKLDVQLQALGEARAQVRRVFWFVPGV